MYSHDRRPRSIFKNFSYVWLRLVVVKTYERYPDKNRKLSVLRRYGFQHAILTMFLLPVTSRLTCRLGVKHSTHITFPCSPLASADTSTPRFLCWGYHLNTLRPGQNGGDFTDIFKQMKLLNFRLKFHWNLFPAVQLTIFEHWLI